jgi:predicted GNAT family acetyltransferase
MRLVRHADATSFLAVAEPALAAREAFFNLPLAIAQTCATDPTRYTGANYFAAIEDAGRGVGVATRTPPHRLLVYTPVGPAIEALADDVAHLGQLPGIHGPAESVEAFAALWTARQGLAARVALHLRAFELTEAIAAPPTTGAMRLATAADLSFVEGAFRAFHAETGALAIRLTPEEIARRAVRDGRLYLWDDGGPVSQAGVVGTTPHGARIGAVYTPPDRRARGYATALVEALSRRVLADGRRFCFLFTDLANSVSNSIYPKVGYRPIGDFRDVDFVFA